MAERLTKKKQKHSDKHAHSMMEREARFDKRDKEQHRKEKREAKRLRRKRRANAIADKELTAEAADNFQAYLSILREWEAKEKPDL